MKTLVLLVLLAPHWMWSAGGLVRSTKADPRGDTQLRRLDEYGWETQHAPLLGLRGDVAWLDPPICDLGLAWAWGRGTFASGPAYDDPDTITGSTLELGGFCRVHWVKKTSPVAAEPRLEAGIARTTATMRGVDSSDRALYTKLGLDFRAGGKKAGAMFSVDYASVHQHGGQLLDLPAGGVTFALSFFWRQW